MHEDLITEALSAGQAVQEAQRELERRAAHRREVVLRMREVGMSFGQIAAHLGVTRSGVQSILRATNLGNGDDPGGKRATRPI